MITGLEGGGYSKWWRAIGAKGTETRTRVEVSGDDNEAV